MEETTKLEHFFNTHKKTTKLLKFIFIFVLICFVVIHTFSNITHNNSETNFIELITKDFDSNTILSDNKIKDENILTLNEKLTSSDINIITNENKLTSDYQNINIVASDSFELTDSEVGTLISLYLNSTDNNKYFNLCEFDILETSDNNLYSAKAIFSLDLAKFINDYLEIESNNLKNIFFTIEGTSRVLAYSFIFDHLTIQVNNLSEKENEIVVNKINSILYGESSNLKKELSNIICNFINNFASKTSTFINLENGKFQFDLKILD